MRAIPLPDPGAHLWPYCPDHQVEALADADDALLEVAAEVEAIPVELLRVDRDSARKYVVRWRSRG